MEFFKEDDIKKFITKPTFDEKVLLTKDTRYPKISVITPSYNQADFLEKTILSILNQNYPNLEFIIMDGGSTDHSVEVIKKYEKYIDYWVSEKDGGQTVAINSGFRKATGDWVTFQNSDDVFAPNALLNVARGIKKNPDVDLFFGHLLMIDGDDLVFEHKKQIPFWNQAQVYEGMQVFNQCMIFKRDLLLQHGYFDENYKFAFDYEICTRWGSIPGIKFKLLDDFWGCFRQHELAKSSTIFTVGLSEHQQIKNHYSKQVPASFPESILYKVIKLRKLALFLFSGDLAYFKYRLGFKRTVKA